MGLLRINNLNYKKNNVDILNNLSLSISAGEVLGLFSQRGSGKSTLLQLLVSKKPTIDRFILIDNKVVDYKYRKDYFHLINGVEDLILSKSALENIAIISNNKRSKIIFKDTVFNEVSAILKRYQINLDLNKKVYKLSETEKILVLFLRGIYRQKKFFLIDDGIFEKKFVVDYKIIKNVMAIMKTENTSFLIASHNIDNLEILTNKVVYLENGTVIYTLPINQAVKRFKLNDSIISGKSKSDEILASIILDKNTGRNLEVDLKEGKTKIIHDKNLKNNHKLYKNLIKANDKGELFTKKAELNLKVAFKDFRTDKMLFRNLNLVDNLLMPSYKKVSKFGFLRPNLKKVILSDFSDFIKKEVKTDKLNYNTLSEKQRLQIYFYQLKVLNPKILICYSPEDYSDITSLKYIYEQLHELEKKGCAIILIATRLYKVDDKHNEVLYLDNGKPVSKT